MDRELRDVACHSVLRTLKEVAAMVACAFSTAAVSNICGAPDPQSKEQPFPLVQEYCHSNATSDPLG
jgi:hypothetical protein